jgi:hypothetical protein
VEKVGIGWEGSICILRKNGLSGQNFRVFSAIYRALLLAEAGARTGVEEVPAVVGFFFFKMREERCMDLFAPPVVFLPVPPEEQPTSATTSDNARMFRTRRERMNKSGKGLSGKHRIIL